MKHFLFQFIDGLGTLYIIVIFIRAFMSWLRQDIIYTYLGFFRFIEKVTEPFLRIIRKLFPVTYRQADFSPIIAVFIVMLVKRGLIYLLEMVI